MKPTPPLEPERYYSPVEAARLSGLPEPTIRKWLAEGLRHIPTGPRGRGQGVRIKGAWLVEFSESAGVRCRPPAEVTTTHVAATGRARRPAKGADGRIVLR